MLWIHGGGFVLDYFDLDDTLCSISFLSSQIIIAHTPFHLLFRIEDFLLSWVIARDSSCFARGAEA
jgi:hypothetical protein